MESRNYILTPEESSRYDSGDDEILDELDREFEHRFGWNHPPSDAKVKTVICHFKGHIAEVRYE